MREVKEKSSLKARAVETLKSAPQAAFRRGTDASFQQLRQELREAAQDGQPEDRYESSKITDTADHAVQEVRHLAEKAAHRLPKTKSEPQREARTESVPQHEQPRQPTTAPREYPPQNQPQGNQSVRESASPIREKPVSPVNVQQPKTREYTPDAKASVSPSQHSTPRIHENVKAVPAETMPSTTEHSVRKSVSPIKEKPVPPANAPQPKMREHAPDAKAPVSSSQHATLRIHEKTQNVSAEITPTPTGSAEKHTAAPFEQSAHHLQMERSAHEQAFPIKEKPVPPANTPQPKMREHTPTADAPVQQPKHLASQIHEKPQAVRHAQVNRSVRELETSVREKPAVKAKPAEQRSLGQSPASTEPSAPATTPTVQPSARTLPRERPPVSSLREPPAALKPDTTQFALPEIKTKEYIRKKWKKQNLLKEEASSIENTIADSEIFSPVIRTRETVREQQNSTFPIVRSRRSRSCRRSEHGSRRRSPYLSM